MPTLLTRRELSLLAAAAGAAAQTTTAPPPPAASDADAVRSALDRNRGAMNSVLVPMDSQPAFVFRP